VVWGLEEGDTEELADSVGREEEYRPMHTHKERER
jgi:hypothetical protein